MEIRYLILYPVVCAALGVLIIPFLPASWKSAGGALFVLLNAVMTTVAAIAALGGNTLQHTLEGGVVFGNIPVSVDPLSAWFILVVNLTCVSGAWYGCHYMKTYVAQAGNLSLHWAVFVLFHIAMVWVSAVHHGLAFLVAWEVMSLSAFLLLMFDYARFNTLNAGINYLVQTHIGVVFLSVAFIWARAAEGTFDFTALTGILNKPGGLWLFLLLFVGFGIKAGFIPLHTWLPHAHPAAPAHISGVMSGVMVTMGIYGIARVLTYLQNNLAAIGAGMVILSTATALYGILSGAIHRDYKRILAFSTIENMGIIGIGLGMGILGKGTGNHGVMFLGFSAAILHVFNHALYKPLLFFASGNIYQFAHTRNMEHLGGLIRKLPFTAFFFLCGALAVGGLPPFNGFVSKFLLFSALVEGLAIEGFPFDILMVGGMMGLALVGGLSVLAFAKSFSVIFLGSPRSAPVHRPSERFSYGHLPLFLILFLMLLAGLSPSILLFALEKVVVVFDRTMSLDNALPMPAETLGAVGLASFITILVAALLYFARSMIVSRRPVDTSPTWRCGYPAPNAKMQYTGKAFSKSLAKLFPFITSEEKKYQEIPARMVVPTNRNYTSSYAEFFEKYVISPLTNQLLNFMNYFMFIHNGRVQYYILYGLIFMLVLIVATFTNLL